jgi:phenylalanyl-tRNA synthetase beta chain
VRFSLDWIREYVDVDGVPADLAHRLTLAGLAVERVEGPLLVPDTVVVGKVLEAKRHPNADRLSLCTVEVGAGEPLEIVCGAPNARTGMYGAVALVGTALPNGTRIKEATIRGVTSRGMLCSEIELGVGEDASGIIELAPAEPGTPYAAILGERDTVFEIDVPSNRGDCLSHVGVAREIAALTGRPLRLPAVTVREGGKPAAEEFRATVESAEDCPRFTAHLIRGVTVGPSPDWLVRRLAAAGQRSINNVVDVTNFVLLETGQPFHAFDLDRLGTGRIHVRRGRNGERLTTLDGVDRPLDPEVLLITDGERPIAAAGVMGGGETEVHDGTRNLLLEVACFRPERILWGSRRLRLETEASLHFRRGVDPVGLAAAARRAASLLAELAGGTVAPGMIDVADPEILRERRVPLRPERVRALIGDPLEDAEIASRLEAFGFAVDRRSGDTWSVGVPSWRRDVKDECDLIEEVARHRGYDAIGVRQYNGSGVGAPIQPEEERLDRVRQVLTGFGYQEAVTRALVPEGAAARAGLDPVRSTAGFFRILDPASREAEGLRVSMLPSLLDVLSHNVRHGWIETRVFEIGQTYRRLPGGDGGEVVLPEETAQVALAAVGGEFGPSRERDQRSLDFLQFKGVVEALFNSFRIDDPQWRFYTASPDSTLAPAGAVEVVVGGRSAGFAWEASAEVRGHWDIPRPVYLAQIRLDALPAETGAPVRYREPSRFPPVRRDLALVVPAAVTQADVREWIHREAGPHLAGVELFDAYRGKHIPAGHIGLGFSLTFRAADRTLEEAEVDSAVARVVDGLRGKGIVRRES